MKGKQMQAIATEVQPSLFAFKLPEPKRFTRLSFFAQDIVETLIKQPSTAEEVADSFSWEYDAVIEELRKLRDLGLVTPAYQCVDGDLKCSNPDCETQCVADGENERGDSCLYSPDACSGILEDACCWQYCGGPISEFFRYIQTRGRKDGIQS